ncbi:YdiU family protein [Simiduia sp. 21SJ11W-1]|uniref:protein adenylyltransferase SelO n=1 Tax=Simiduia sp. 21SJ11W-1 TaxID=2909669 RepID=UPI00209EF22D|nr:YdiU family protein [Simiduia sp. 21SJ11W-1]UTA47294.1 YdiU family protein [Simiduia sp. 21SJ11W-1]
MPAKFDNSFARLGPEFGTRQMPLPLANATLIHLNQALAEALALPQEAVQQMVLGEPLPPGCEPLAMVYAGHQFGGFSPQLGDGRGLLLGEWCTAGNRWDLHLKGAGRTPYSRFGDGRAVLRSSLREYLGSAAMQGLGIPTTQALALAGSRQTVMRERAEPGATLLRVTRCHIRFGHFEYFFYQNQQPLLEKLVNYCASRYLAQGQYSPDDTRANARALLALATRSTAKLIAHWQATGFAHGVMNTDNMSLIGETFDFGPYGFLDDFEPGFICNHSDDQGRYAFDRQAAIGLWNLNALAHSLSGLIAIDDIKTELAHYQHTLSETYYTLMMGKLGLKAQANETQQALLQDLLTLLAANRTDYTGFFRALSESAEQARDLITDRPGALQWLERYSACCNQAAVPERETYMRARNPKFILRNYLAQQAIESAEAGDFSMLEDLFTVLSAPYDEHPGHSALAKPPAAHQKHLPVSCSS